MAFTPLMPSEARPMALWNLDLRNGEHAACKESPTNVYSTLSQGP